MMSNLPNNSNSKAGYDRVVYDHGEFNYRQSMIKIGAFSCHPVGEVVNWNGSTNKDCNFINRKILQHKVNNLASIHDQTAMCLARKNHAFGERSGNLASI